MEIYSIDIQEEKDILASRDRARVICEELGFGTTEQLQVTTSVFELCKNILEHGKGGKISFSLLTEDKDLILQVEGEDNGPGFTEEQKNELLTTKRGVSTALRGIPAMKRLMDTIEIESEPGEGTHIRLTKKKKESTKTLARNIVNFFQDKFSSRKNPTLFEELRMQNLNLVQTLSLFEEKNKELGQTNQQLLQLKKELESSNGKLQERTAELQEALLDLGDRTTELEAKNRSFSAVLKEMSQGMVITDRSGSVTIANPRFLELFELDQEKAQDLSKQEFLSLLGKYHSEPNTKWSIITHQIDNQPKQTHNFILENLPNQSNSIACKSTPILDEDDKLVGRLWFFE